MKKTRALLLVLWMSSASGGLVHAQAPVVTPCVIVYGNGRNLGDARENEAWDRANLRFNTAVVERLAVSGLRALPMVFRVGELTPRASVDLLVAQVQREGCQRVVDTAVFANEDSAALVVRLRVHPMLASLGPRLATAQPTIGEPLFTSQRDFDLGSRRPLDAVPLEALARQMVEDYLAGQGLNQAGR